MSFTSAEEIGHDEVHLNLFLAGIKITLRRKGKAERNGFEFLRDSDFCPVGDVIVLEIGLVFVANDESPFVGQDKGERKKGFEKMNLRRISFSLSEWLYSTDGLNVSQGVTSQANTANSCKRQALSLKS